MPKRIVGGGGTRVLTVLVMLAMSVPVALTAQEAPSTGEIQGKVDARRALPGAWKSKRSRGRPGSPSGYGIRGGAGRWGW
jgi:hypothetical protein